MPWPAIHGSPSRLDDQGHPQSCVIEADLCKPHAASATNRVPTILTTNGFGGSYGGQIQFATAAADPRVDTLVPLITWNDLRNSPPGSLPANTTTPYDAPGTLGAWTTQALTSDTSIVGVPTLDVTFTSPAVAAAQPAGPAGQLQVFAKLYDIAPDGSTSLVNKLISPVRVADVTRPVHIELPGIVHRVPAGHRLRLVLASTDAAYKNAYTVQPVTVTADPLAPAVLRIPVIG